VTNPGPDQPTRLPVLGYEVATQIAKEALDTGRCVYEIAQQRKLLTRDEPHRILNPEAMTEPRTLD
jgi:aspartate ammonia-lyase